MIKLITNKHNQSGEDMYDIERKEKIIEILREKKSCSVAYLAKMLCFSEATIRRDLNALDAQMLIRKTFGGAVYIEKYGGEVPIHIRRDENAAVKDALCRAASKLICDNMTVFLAASTTVEHIVPYLSAYKGLTVVTNNPDIPGKLADTDFAVYCTGGRYLHHSNSYVGDFAKSIINRINTDIAFFSARGISMDGKLTQSSTEDDVNSVILQNTAKSCLIADSSKFGKVYPFIFGNLESTDYVVTDKLFPNIAEHKGIIIG